MYDFIFVLIERFSLALTAEALQGKTCYQEGVGQLEPRFQWSSLGNIFGFYKTRHILLSDSVN